MDAKELFHRCLAQATQVMEHVRERDFGQPTPDTEWDVRTLASHMLYELSWTADLVRGATIEQVGGRYEGDLIAGDLLRAWQTVAAAAEVAVEACTLGAPAHLSYGDATVEDYLREAASDQLIHAWDLGTAIHLPVKFDEEVAQAVYQNTLPKARGMQASGLFSPIIKVPETADLQTKLLALYGRRQLQ